MTSTHDTHLDPPIDAAETTPTPDASDPNLQSVDALQQAVAAKEAELASLRRQVTITDALAAEPVIDLGAARVLVEFALDRGDATDPAAAVEQLRRDKPFLFRAPAPRRSLGVTAAQTITNTPNPTERAAEALDDAASNARATGRPTDLMRYLRLRRSV